VEAFEATTQQRRGKKRQGRDAKKGRLSGIKVVKTYKDVGGEGHGTLTENRKGKMGVRKKNWRRHANRRNMGRISDQKRLSRE